MAFAVREDWVERPGGDSVQVRNTARELRGLGVEVEITSDPQADTSPYDLVHIFHLTRVHESYPHFANARARGTPVVVSTIYWPWRRGVRPGPLGKLWREIVEDGKNVVRRFQARSRAARRGAGKAAVAGFGRCCRRIVAGARMLLPNSQAELELLRAEFGAAFDARVVVNGVDAEACRKVLAQPAAGRGRHVLCVGHFDPRKNQLGLIEALRNVDLPVYFVGEARPMHQGYLRRCRRRARPGMHFLGRLGHEEVLTLMRGSELFVSPSRAETPGLASLEAAAMGCRLALGSCPPVREYFGGGAVYFDPSDPAGIRDGVLQAMRTDPSDDFARRVLTDYDWSVAAAQTLDAYTAVLGLSSAGR